MNARDDKPKEYFSKLLDLPDTDIDYREVPATTKSDWQDAEILLPVTEQEFRAIENFVRTHRKKSVSRSAAYELFAQALATRKQILCSYDGYRRELCPIILGHSRGREKALTYQFGGESKTGLPRGGQWRCLFLSRVREIELRDGAWHTGDSHTQPQGCVEIVDLDVNPASPYAPRRFLRA